MDEWLDSGLILDYYAGDQRQIKLLDSSYVKVMRLLQSHHDITFMASVRQEPFNVGTLFSLSTGFTRYIHLLLIFSYQTDRVKR